MSTKPPRPAYGDEVMTMTDETELNRLMDVAGSEGEALAALAGCVDRLHQVHAARAALARLDARSLRAALEARRTALEQEGTR
ncbi:hypothetical protein BN12_4240002 [Nostocoides japonicum T1-X7]|uniref:Uncharacterized protein n=2 Tax=Nostocoides japonicum TaxID=99481 RepID=A0A077M5G6_9MICO|nr:hypothetical protein BN12_4120004 [Tetrasphaera japonica T1-X7]CCH79404.1 hypothetical protein BN12_4240002 [Tetrasphaera japonica T1-X7]